MRILLIEDDISLCNALMIHLRSEGYETDVCHNGTDGLSYALQNTYDVIILDRMLPELDGLTLLSAIRRKNIFTPVIIDKSNDVIDFDIDRHRIFCSKQNFKILLENLLCLSIMMKSKIFMLPSSFVT